MEKVRTVATNICVACERLLDEASAAMRRHAAEMNTAINLVRSGGVTEEARQDFKARLLESFNDAQSAWDVYREHLLEHGILPKES